MKENTATQSYLDRFKARANFVGQDGGIYTIRPLKPSEIFRLRDMLKDADGATFNVLTAIASITQIEIDGSTLAIVFPKTRRDLDGLLDRVGFKGIGELTPAFNKLNADEEQDAGETESSAEVHALSAA